MISDSNLLFWGHPVYFTGIAAWNKGIHYFTNWSHIEYLILTYDICVLIL